MKIKSIRNRPIVIGEHTLNPNDTWDVDVETANRLMSQGLVKIVETKILEGDKICQKKSSLQKKEALQ